MRAEGGWDEHRGIAADAGLAGAAAQIDKKADGGRQPPKAVSPLAVGVRPPDPLYKRRNDPRPRFQPSLDPAMRQDRRREPAPGGFAGYRSIIIEIVPAPVFQFRVDDAEDRAHTLAYLLLRSMR